MNVSVWDPFPRRARGSPARAPGSPLRLRKPSVSGSRSRWFQRSLRSRRRCASLAAMPRGALVADEHHRRRWDRARDRSGKRAPARHRVRRCARLRFEGAAEEGKLLILASGPAVALDTLAPLFSALGQKTMRWDRAGSGSRMKLVLNTWLACSARASPRRRRSRSPRRFHNGLERVSGPPRSVHHGRSPSWTR